MNKDEIAKKVKDIVWELYLSNCRSEKEQLALAKEYSLKSRLNEDLGLDSMDRTELAMELEKEFAISISDDEIDNIENVGDVVNCVVSKKR